MAGEMCLQVNFGCVVRFQMIGKVSYTVFDDDDMFNFRCADVAVSEIYESSTSKINF